MAFPFTVAQSIDGNGNLLPKGKKANNNGGASKKKKTKSISTKLSIGNANKWGCLQMHSGENEKNDKNDKDKKASAKSPQSQRSPASSSVGPQSSPDKSDKSDLLVELAPMEALLQAWMPLNRAYGWGVNLEQLSVLCSRLGGKLGAIVDPTTSLGAVPEVAEKGCVWVTFRTDTAGEPEHTSQFAGEQSAVSLSEFLVSSTGVTGDKGDKLIGDSVTVNSVTVNIRNVSPAPNGDPDYVRVLVPLMCLRKASDDLRRSKSGNFGPGGAALKIGSIVRVAQESVLQVSLSLSLRFKGSFLYTGGVLFHVEWCIRQVWCSLIYSITSIAHDHYADIYPFFNHSYLQTESLRAV